jgi:hypothetical protein
LPVIVVPVAADLRAAARAINTAFSHARFGSPYNEMMRTSPAIIAAIQPSMGYAKLCMSMRLGNARYSANPVDLGAQSDLIGAPESVSTEAVLAAPIGGLRAGARGESTTLRVQSQARG